MPNGYQQVPEKKIKRNGKTLGKPLDILHEMW